MHWGWGRPSVADADRPAYATHLREAGRPTREIVAETGTTRTALYRHLPPRPPERVTPGPVTVAESDSGATA